MNTQNRLGNDALTPDVFRDTQLTRAAQLRGSRNTLTAELIRVPLGVGTRLLLPGMT
ncbi:hypothetical protein J6590_063876 [Homalodisca vitripennis]|nr:hypothetical protein J6590_063876 [Homalodisca vitripennis]